MIRKINRITAVLVLIASCMAACSGAAFAAALHRTETVITMQIDNPHMNVNGVTIDIDNSGTAPLIYNGRTLMPIRAFAESIGAAVTWNNSLKNVIISYNGRRMMLTIDDPIAYVAYSESRLDVPPMIINDRTFLPIRFVAESFGCDVDWDEGTRTITAELHKENVQHAAVVYDSDGGEAIRRAAEITADILGADLYSAEDADFLADDYNTILIGYSAKDGKLSSKISDLLHANDLRRRHIAPFCIGDIGDSEREISVTAAGSYVEDGLEIGQADAKNESDMFGSITSWLTHIKLIQR